MYCEECGRKSNPGELYCTGCGTKLRNNFVSEINMPADEIFQKEKQSNKKLTKIILGSILAFFVFIAIIVLGTIAITFSYINKFETKTFIEFGSDKIPTVYSALGQKKIVSIKTESNNDNKKLTLIYNSNSLILNDLVRYLQLLSNNDFELVDDDSSVYMFVKKSNDPNKLLYVYINKDYIGGSVVINYVKDVGNINNYKLAKEKDGYIKIGKTGYGYLTVTDDIKPYYSSNSSKGTLQYSNEDKNLLIVLSRIEDSQYSITDYVNNYSSNYEKEGGVVKVENEEIAGYSSYSILVASEDGLISKEWLIQVDSAIYYVYMATYENPDIFEWIHSYQINS